MDNVTIEYLQCDFSNCFVDFRIQGLHNNDLVNEVVRISANDMYKLKFASKPIKISIDFLRTVKYIKDNLDNTRVKRTLINLAIRQHKVHEEEMEELMLMLELSKSSKEIKSKENIMYNTYNEHGNKVYL